MRNIILSVVIVFGFTSLSASHYRGADITWTCLGNGQYIFHLNRYVKCTVLQPFPGLINIQGPQGTIAMNWYNTKDVSVCPGRPGGCGLSGLNSGPIELRQYRSNVVTLNGSPPPSGWAFSYGAASCCRDVGAVNLISISNGPSILVKSVMYNGVNGCVSSPYFDVNSYPVITPFNRSIESHAYTENAEDSLYYSFGPPRYQNQVAVAPSAGYTYQNPFPNVNHDTANGNVSMNPHTGMISYKSVNGLNGAYYFVVVVEQWRNNTLLSLVTREYGMPAVFSGFTNNPPVVSIDTAMYPKIQKIDPMHYVIDVGVGDTIDFEIMGIDTDVDPQTLQYPNVTFEVNGTALDTAWKDSSIYTNNAAVVPVAPQSSFTHRHSNNVRFLWVPSREHVGRPISSHQFVFRFHDNRCDSAERVGMQHVLFEVKLHANQGTLKDSLSICAGDSTILDAFLVSRNYQWSPSSGLSSDTVAGPKASPSASQYYYLTDPVNPGFVDSVYVHVTPKSTSNLAFSNGQLTLTDSAQTSTPVWHYNGIPFNYAYDTLAPFGLGDYYVAGTAGVCPYISDTISIAAGMILSMTEPGNGYYDSIAISGLGSIGVTFSVKQNVKVNWLSLPGLVDLFGNTNQYDFNLKVYDTDSNWLEIFNKDIVLNQPVSGLQKIGISGLTLQANKRYTIGISGDTGYAFSFIKHMQYPATPHNVGLDVQTNGVGAHRQFPVSAMPGFYSLPISLGIDKTVSLYELGENTWSIYPNPAKDQIKIVGLNGASAIELMDANGKLVRTVRLEKDQKDVNLNRGDLASGLYFIKVQFDNSTSVKKVLFQ